VLNPLSPVEAMELLISRLEKVRNNAEFLANMNQLYSALFKQSTAPLLLMLLLDPLIRRQLTQAFAMLAGALTVPMIVFLALRLRREPFAANFFAISHSRVDLARIGSIFTDALHQDEIAAMHLALAILGMVVSRSTPGYASLARITLAAWLFTLVSLANVGSNFNYLVLAYLLSLVFVPPAFIWLSHCSRLLQRAPVLLGVISAEQILHLLDQPRRRGLLSTVMVSASLVTSSRCARFSLRGICTTTFTIRSPCPSHSGRERRVPRTRSSLPLCVPSGILMFTGPSMPGISNSAPMAACGKLMGSTQCRSCPWRSKKSCGRMERMMYRSPFGPPTRPDVAFARRSGCAFPLPRPAAPSRSA
jgi:hypothetical protein